MRNFVAWSLLTKKLAPQTVRDYLSSIGTLHKLHSFDLRTSGDLKIDLLLRGAENMQFYNKITEKTRLVVTLPILRILGHEIAKSDWEKENKLTFWAACVVAFFGSFRMGEILSKSESSFNSSENLLWEDVTMSENHILFHIKIAKTRCKKGEYIDIFPFPFMNCCPVAAMKCMKSSLAGSSCDPKEPVFKFKSGKLLTVENFSTTIKSLLFPHIGEKANWFAAHSFRAGIPSTLAADPEAASEEEIKKWGRWSSASYQSYTRLKLDQKRSIYDKITKVLSQEAQKS